MRPVLLEGANGHDQARVAGQVGGDVDPAELVESERGVFVHGDKMRGTGLLRTVVGLTFAVQLGLLLWSRTLSPLVVLLSAAVLAAAVAAEWKREAASGGEEAKRGTGGATAAIRIAQALLALGLITATATTGRLEWGSGNWDQVVATRQTQLAARLEDRLGGAAARVADGYGALVVLRGREHEVAEVLLVERGGADHVLHAAHERDVERAVVRRAVGPGDATFDADVLRAVCRPVELAGDLPGFVQFHAALLDGVIGCHDVTHPRI